MRYDSDKNRKGKGKASKTRKHRPTSDWGNKPTRSFKQMRKRSLEEEEILDKYNEFNNYENYGDFDSYEEEYLDED